MIKNKIKEWLKRYSIPLVLGTIAAIVSAIIFKATTGNNIISGILATWVDNIVFYGYIALHDLKKVDKDAPKFKAFIKQVRNMVIEFGPAEYLDSFLIRPFFLSIFPYFIGNYPLAIFLGSAAAEVTYFIPTIISYELRKKVLKD